MAEGFFNFTGEVDFRNQTELRMAGGANGKLSINAYNTGSEVGENENGDGTGAELVMVTNGGFDRHLLYCSAGVETINDVTNPANSNSVSSFDYGFKDNVGTLYGAGRYQGTGGTDSNGIRIWVNVSPEAAIAFQVSGNGGTTNGTLTGTYEKNGSNAHGDIWDTSAQGGTDGDGPHVCTRGSDGRWTFTTTVSSTAGLKCWVSEDQTTEYPWLVASWVKDTEAGTGTIGPTMSSVARTPFQIRKGVASNPDSNVDHFHVFTNVSYGRHTSNTFGTAVAGESLGAGVGYPFIRMINLNGDTEFTNLDGKLTRFQINAGLSNGVAPIKWKVWLTRFQSLIITKKPNDRLFVRKSNFDHTVVQNYAISANSDGTNVTMHPLNEYLGRDFVVDPIGIATGIAGYDNRTTLDNASLLLFSNHSVDQVLFVMICNPAGDIIKEVPVPKHGIMKIKKEPQETIFCLKASFEISGNGVKTASAGTVESSAGSAVKIAYVG